MAGSAHITPRVPPRQLPGSPRLRPVASAITPAALGYHMPGEFGPHACTWLSWPGATTRAWSDAGGITTEIVEVARAIRRFEPVRVAVDPEFHAEAAQRLGPDHELLVLPVDDIWTRDTGPTFLLGPNSSVAAATWNFNAWGNKFAQHDKDALLARRIADSVAVPAYAASIVAEGGGLHVDGEGTVVATESSILNSNRNPGVSRQEVEVALHDWLGTSKVIWIPATTGSDCVDTQLHDAAVGESAREQFDGRGIGIAVTKCRDQHRAIENQAVHVAAAEIRGIDRQSCGALEHGDFDAAPAGVSGQLQRA